MSQAPSIVWFRHDLRLKDNPALLAALKRAAPVLPVFIWAPDEDQDWPPGAASRWWLHQSLASLDSRLQSMGSKLLVFTEDTLECLIRLVEQTGAAAVFWNRRYEPVCVARDTKVKSKLKDLDRTVESFNGNLLFDPAKIEKKSGGPYQVFTPFWEECLRLPRPNDPEPAPESIPSPQKWPESLSLDALELETKIDSANGIREAWQPGEAGAAANLKRFVDEARLDYSDNRDRPDLLGTSRLSPHLHFGEISPRRVWKVVKESAAKPGGGRKSREQKAAESYLRELGWREFAHHLLYHFPQTTDEPLRKEFAAFPWEQDTKRLEAWQSGRTGYPFVDAGMRQLWTTGWMHNRVRMVAGSFLVKDLLITWKSGAEWFWDTLVDADLANNTLGWQWVAGCGADAAPFFRIFNPISQGEKFDPRGDYVRRWAPELEKLPDKWIHKPWEAPSDVLADAGVELGKTYPKPVVDHKQARERALAAFDSIKSKKSENRKKRKSTR